MYVFLGGRAGPGPARRAKKGWPGPVRHRGEDLQFLKIYPQQIFGGCLRPVHFLDPLAGRASMDLMMHQIMKKRGPSEDSTKCSK